MAIIDNYKHIKEDINKIALSSKRKLEEIFLLPVSKTFPAETIQEAINSGIKVFGENKVQEASEKSKVLTGDFKFHLIGHLQSNKAKYSVKLFDLIHGIDKLSTAEKLNKEAEKIQKIQKILVQVNTSKELTKSGIDPDQTEELCGNIKKFSNIKLCGLMTIGPLTDNISDVSDSFAALRKLKESINQSLQLSMTELSMGMSSDYDIAIKEGATIVRIGSAIFGERDYSI